MQTEKMCTFAQPYFCIMNKIQLVEQIKIKKSFLCIGLDVDLEKSNANLYSGKIDLNCFSKALYLIKETALFSKQNL